ncbi:hypothetical protein KR215_009567 [Drosophila sulfurigaster]|nr:hypothetical protein KR215_009567 [Drosophila sulfurigaster]
MASLKWQIIFLTFLFFQLNDEVASEPMKRIVNGSNAIAKQFPYQTFLYTFKNYEWYATCGGVIISSKAVLTAAHCIADNAVAFIIFIGAVNLTDSLEPGQQRVIVKRSYVVVHPEWDEFQLINDIALIKLPVELHFNEYVQPAKLPNPKHLYDNEMGVVSGWGNTESSDTGSAVLKYYVVGVLPLDECATQLKELRGSSSIVPQSYICLKPSDSSPCNGDSGGPLAIKNPDGHSTLLGLASFVVGACETNKPSVYTRVSSFLSWINNQTEISG